MEKELFRTRESFRRSRRKGGREGGEEREGDLELTISSFFSFPFVLPRPQTEVRTNQVSPFDVYYLVPLILFDLSLPDMFVVPSFGSSARRSSSQPDLDFSSFFYQLRRHLNSPRLGSQAALRFREPDLLPACNLHLGGQDQDALDDLGDGEEDRRGESLCVAFVLSRRSLPT